MSEIGDSSEIKQLFEDEKISPILETEIGRYVSFFDSSYKDNLNHSEYVIDAHPRWSIISGYYAMHDYTKLCIAKHYHIKIEEDVHQTTIKVLNEILKDEELIALIENGYEEYRNMASELSKAKKERTHAQYYTGSAFSSDNFKRRSKKFHDGIVAPFIEKMGILLGD